MAKELTPEEKAQADEKKRLSDEKKQLKKEQKEAKKEAKKRAREIAEAEEELDDEEKGGGFITFMDTIFIVLLWVSVICIIIKLDIGGFGSTVLAPLLKNVPVVNKILPNTGTVGESEGTDPYAGYASLEEAVAQIRSLELQLESAQTSINSKDEQIESLNTEVKRLQEFERMQVEFQRIRTEFYEEVVYSDKGPGAEEYKKYYEGMDPATADYLYKQVVQQLQASAEITQYALTYSEMKPDAAAKIFEKMTDNLNLVAKILKAMSAEDRGKILAAMEPDTAARLTKILDPES